RLPPPSTPLPYTTLFRSPGGAGLHGRPGARQAADPARAGPAVTSVPLPARPTVVVTRKLPGPVEDRLEREFEARLNRDDHPFTRSEEHTSELQSRSDLVC